MRYTIPNKLFGVDGQQALEKILSQPEKAADPYPKPVSHSGSYQVIHGLTYGRAMANLRTCYSFGPEPTHPTCSLPDGRTQVRPLTLRETAIARLDDYATLRNPDGSYRTEQERLYLFHLTLSTCTGITRGPRAGKFKILPQCAELLGLPSSFNEETLTLNYANLPGTEFDYREVQCYQPLTRGEVVNHPAWIEAFEDDTSTLEAYAQLSFGLLNRNYAMRWQINGQPSPGELVALSFGSTGGGSNAIGFSRLTDGKRFVCVHSSKAQEGGK